MNMPRRRIILIIIVAVILSALAYAAYRIYPYVRPAPITDEVAQAMLAEYTKLAAELEDRPSPDGEVIVKLYAQWKDRFETAKDLPFAAGDCPCPLLPDDFGPETVPLLDEFPKFSAALGEIIDDGFILMTCPH